MTHIYIYIYTACLKQYLCTRCRIADLASAPKECTSYNITSCKPHA